MKAIILSDNGFEDTELLCPYYRLLEAGFEADVAAIKKGEITGKHGYSVNAQLTIKEVKPENYDALILPGGKAPEKVRLAREALALCRDFMESGKPVATICHGVQILISAQQVEGRKGTCYVGIQDDLKAAGCSVVDEEVVVDDNWISSRNPRDIPAFNRELMKKLKEAK